MASINRVNLKDASKRVIQSLGHTTDREIVRELQSERYGPPLVTGVEMAVFRDMETFKKDLASLTRGKDSSEMDNFIARIKDGKQVIHTVASVKAWIKIKAECYLVLHYHMAEKEFSSRICMVKTLLEEEQSSLFVVKGDNEMQCSLVAVLVAYMLNGLVCHTYGQEATNTIHKIGEFSLNSAYKKKRSLSLGPICLGYRGMAQRATMYSFDENLVSTDFIRVGSSLRRLPQHKAGQCSLYVDHIEKLDSSYRHDDCQCSVLVSKIRNFHDELQRFEVKANQEKDNRALKRCMLSDIEAMCFMAKRKVDELTMKGDNPKYVLPWLDDEVESKGEKPDEPVSMNEGDEKGGQ